MGSGFSICTIKEAAKLLGRSSRTVKLYIEEGLIRKWVDSKGKMQVSKVDVETLVMEREGAFPAFNRQNFYALLDRLRKLEQDMTVVRKVLDLRGEPLYLNEQYAQGLITEANLALAARANQWTYEELQTWANLLYRFNANTLEILSKVGNKERPWELFYTLCTALIAYVEEYPEHSYNNMWALLDQARLNVRNEAILWIELNKGAFPKGAYWGLNNEKEDLLDRLKSSSEIDPQS